MTTSGTCPTPRQKSVITYSDTVPTKDTKDVDPPTPTTTKCNADQSTTTVVAPRPNGTNTTVSSYVCVPGIQGPVGPQGPQGVAGVGIPAGGTAGQVLAKIDGTDYNVQWVDDQTGGAGSGTLNYAGRWAAGTVYQPDDVVNHENSSFVCVSNHTADNINKPDLTILAQENKGLLDGFFNTVGNFLGDIFGKEDEPAPTASEYWVLLSKGEQEKRGLLGGVFDWIKDIKNWEVSDYLLAAVGAVGIYKAGQEIVDLFDIDPISTPEYNAKFTGAVGYIGPFTPPTLPNVISSAITKAGISNYDVSLLPSREVHLTIRDVGEWRNLFEVLSRAYQFDIVSTFATNRRLKFLPRTNAPIRTITREEIGFIEGTSGAAPYVGKRLQGSDLPKSVSISYFSNGYSQRYLTQTSHMRTYPQGKDVTITLPITLSDQEAKDLADLILMNAHIERSSFSFVTDLNHMDIEAGDVVDVENIGTVRIMKVSTGSEDGTVEFVGVDAGLNITPVEIYSGPTLIGYTASINSASGEPPVLPDVDDSVQPIVLAGGLPLDLPPLNDSDRTPRMHLAVHNFGHSADMNVSIYQSKDGGTTYNKIGVTNKKSTWGKVSTALPAPSNFRFIDTVNTITVQLKSGTLSSCTDLEFYNNKNRCMLGLELINFRDVTDLGSGTYQLSHLLRGRQGTDVYVDDHENNEMFVLVDDSLFEVPMDLVDRNITYKYKFVNDGYDISNVTARDFAPNFRNYYPWAISNLTVIKDHDTEIIAARWLRRWKWDTDIVDGRSSLPDDDIGGYKVLVLDPITDDLINEYVVSGNAWEYTGAQQIADFGSVQDEVNIRIVAISKWVGPGHPAVEPYVTVDFNCGC